MAQAHIYWEADDYAQVEALLDQCTDVCQDHGVWRSNLAHALFMQGLSWHMLKCPCCTRLVMMLGEM